MRAAINTASRLDVLGPWPVYIFTAAAVIVMVWAMMTWPWEHATIGAAGSRRGGSSVGRAADS